MSHPVDVHVGRKLKQIRTLRRLSQTDVARKLNLSFQQIQKYETGMNRVSASRLWDISEALSVPVAFFFEGMDAVASQPDIVEADASGAVPADILADKEALELVRSYYAIPENQRRRLFELARVLSDVA